MEIFIQGHHRDYVNDRPGYYIFDTMLMLNNGDRTFTEVDLSLPDVGEGGQAMADFNNDGKLDLVFAGATIPWHTNGENGLDQNDSSTLITEVYRNETSAARESVLEINRDRLNFGADSSGLTTGAQVLLITNSGSGTMNWSAAADSNWLDYSPSSGTNDGEIIVSVDASGLSKGTYNETVTITAPNAVNSPQTLNVTLKVYNNGETSEPFGQFTTPIDGSTVRSSIPVTGWVLDDIGAESVKIYRGDVGNLVYIGDAVFVDGARPDVETAYPGYPRNYRAGWGYMMLTHFLPNGGNGTYKIHAIAADAEGHRVILGTKTITVDNANAVKPFGAIDIPGQGGTASGTNYRNQGWVLTPMPNAVPTDGSTISVIVDGVNLGHPHYNVYRPDIASLFPGYANSEGALAYFDVDTTTFSNGVHTIAWSAEDNAGNVDGIGSRYFSIRNTGSRRSSNSARDKMSPVIRPEDLGNLPVDNSLPAAIKKGYGAELEPGNIIPGEAGVNRVELRELERIKIRLSNAVTGYLAVGGQLKRLPVGSSFDIETGTFHWVPGPGFIGDYRLVFAVKGRGGKVSRKDILVKIVPGFSLERQQ
jgi:hypothetical protein